MKRVLILSLMVALVLMVIAPVPVMAKPFMAKLDRWHVPNDFPTIQEAIDSTKVQDGDTIVVEPGAYAGAEVTKAVTIFGRGGAVINSGPLPWPGVRPFMAGFLFPGGDDDGSGATITHFQFEDVEFPVFSRGASNVTITHCTMTGSIQGISNWHGDGWRISYNTFNGLATACGGGIGIFIGCCYGGTASNNMVTHNSITGQIAVPGDDCGGYNGSGICLMSDRRWGAAGGELAENCILLNRVALSSSNPGLVESVGIELTDMGLELNTLDNGTAPDLTGNSVAFNNLRGMEGEPIALNPEEVSDNNIIFHNMGADSHWDHGLFHPGDLMRQHQQPKPF